MSALSFARKAAQALAAALFILCASVAALGQAPEKVTPCKLKEDPAAFNHKLVEMTGFVSHGFEDFTLFDPECATWPALWLDYGGLVSSNTIYCCGPTASQKRPRPVVVEGIEVPLVKDEPFRAFDEKILRGQSTLMHATLVGRFFSGVERKWPGGTSWGGYGHMGCCSLLVIQRVVSVDPQDRDDLDYAAEVDAPDLGREHCGYSYLPKYAPPDERLAELLAAQRRAEEGESAWAFEDPRRVAADALAKLAKLDEKALANLRETRREAGRVVFRLIRGEGEKSYMVVVNRPYLLSFYAKDPKRVAWVVAAAYETSCGEDNNVTLISADPPARPKKRRARQSSRRR